MLAGPAGRMRLYYARYKEFGFLYAGLAPLRSATCRLSRRLAALSDAIETRLLEIEERKAVLGPVHRAYTGHSSRENRAVWSEWDWSRGGEEWTEGEEWKASLIDEILVPNLRNGREILEIGPGGGRWSEVLQPRAERLVLVDVTERALELCRERFRDAANVEYVLTEGATLPNVADRSIDFVWSFDAFVHIAPLDIASYLSELARVLRPGGRAVIHHSGRFERGPGWRSPMTAALVARLADERRLTVREQLDSWGDGRFGVKTNRDVITVLEWLSESASPSRSTSRASARGG
jgi:SAM-dependent methyltransferase